jgi:putative membrane protein
MKLTTTDFIKVRNSIIIFYLVGSIGFVVPVFFEYFKSLTSLALIVNFILLSFFHEDKTPIVQWFVFATIYFLGLLIEVLGVQSGLIFGNYYYGEALGFKVFGTPLLIGLNWLFLVYVSSSLFVKTNINSYLKVFLASTIMLLYDILLEQIAPMMELWFWKNDVVPIQNYLVWFIMALIFNIIVVFCNVNTHNRLAMTLLLCQTLFFFIVFLRFIIF